VSIPERPRRRNIPTKRALLAPPGPLSDVDLGLIPECAVSDPVTRLNAALEGRYAMERELGEGGMATVYLAEDLKHKRNVAVEYAGEQRTLKRTLN